MDILYEESKQELSLYYKLECFPGYVDQGMNRISVSSSITFSTFEETTVELDLPHSAIMLLRAAC